MLRLEQRVRYFDKILVSESVLSLENRESVVLTGREITLEHNYHSCSLGCRNRNISHNLGEGYEKLSTEGMDDGEFPIEIIIWDEFHIAKTQYGNYYLSGKIDSFGPRIIKKFGCNLAKNAKLFLENGRTIAKVGILGDTFIGSRSIFIIDSEGDLHVVIHGHIKIPGLNCCIAKGMKVKTVISERRMFMNDTREIYVLEKSESNFLKHLVQNLIPRYPVKPYLTVYPLVLIDYRNQDIQLDCKQLLEVPSTSELHNPTVVFLCDDGRIFSGIPGRNRKVLWEGKECYVESVKPIELEGFDPTQRIHSIHFIYADIPWFGYFDWECVCGVFLYETIESQWWASFGLGKNMKHLENIDGFSAAILSPRSVVFYNPQTIHSSYFESGDNRTPLSTKIDVFYTEIESYHENELYNVDMHEIARIKLIPETLNGMELRIFKNKLGKKPVYSS
jgi:hypothetical protein